MSRSRRHQRCTRITRASEHRCVGRGRGQRCGTCITLNKNELIAASRWVVTFSAEWREKTCAISCASTCDRTGCRQGRDRACPPRGRTMASSLSSDNRRSRPVNTTMRPPGSANALSCGLSTTTNVHSALTKCASFATGASSGRRSTSSSCRLMRATLRRGARGKAKTCHAVLQHASRWQRNVAKQVSERHARTHPLGSWMAGRQDGQLLARNSGLPGAVS